MTFSSPLWWWAAAAVLVPIAVHLLSRGRRRRIPVGTIRFLGGAESRTLRRFRPSGWWQLLLRVALIASLALALAGPRTESTPAPGPETRWLLIDPAIATDEENGPEASDWWQRLERSRDEATEIRWLAPGLPDANEPLRPESETQDAWSLVAEADRAAPRQAGLEIVTRDRASWLIGQRPILTRVVNWWTVPGPPVTQWIDRATARSNGAIDVTIGRSSPSGTEYVTGDASASGELAVDGDRLVLRGPDPEGSDEVERPRLPPPLRITVSHDLERERDAAIVELALQALADARGWPIVTTENADAEAALTVRLGSEADPPGRGPVLTDSDVSGLACDARLVSAGWASVADVALRRCPSSELAEAALWTDPWGRPMLGVDRVRDRDVFRWHGRFDATWSDLSLSPALPRLLERILSAESGSTGSPDRDQRPTWADERSPRLDPSPPAVVATVSDRPESLAWLVAVLLFAADRLTAGRPGW